MLVPSHRALAQQISITLRPGWNWITYTLMEPKSLDEAFGNFSPAEGDIIKSQEAHCTYHDSQWFGSLDSLRTGVGYMYMSQRSTPVTFSFGGVVMEAYATTLSPTGVTAVSASCGGIVAVSHESVQVLIRGVCWSTDSVPSFEHNFMESGSGIGNFSVYLSNLVPNTTYFVRAFAVTEFGIHFGESKSFTTRSGRPTLTTSNVTDIESNMAMGGGVITDDGGAAITERGVCWSINHNPTYADSHASGGSGIGSFQVAMTGLGSGVKYYVCAYAINSIDTVYGNERSFTTVNTGPVCPEGAINGLFSVSATQQVFFAKGNLQYQASTNTWRFAENQKDIIGTNNSHISSTYSGWIDLFGWGTSGFNHGAVCYQPWSISTRNSDYFAYGSTNYHLYSQTGRADWGYNRISNGGNTLNTWRTLTMTEWNYVFNVRSTTSGVRFAKACVDGMNGVIVLPDNWNSSIYEFTYPNQGKKNFSSNVISASVWNTIESAGAIFLPAGGGRGSNMDLYVGQRGFYWSSTKYNDDTSYYLYIRDALLDPKHKSNGYRCFGGSVRLAQDAQ